MNEEIYWIHRETLEPPDHLAILITDGKQVRVLTVGQPDPPDIEKFPWWVELGELLYGR